MAGGKKHINRKKLRRVVNLGGGKPKPGERYESGAITRAERARRERKAEEEARSLGLEQRQRHLGVTADQAKDQESPLVSWRWLQSGEIQKHHHEAGVRFAELWFGYLRAIDDHNSRLKRTAAGYTDPEDPAYIERCSRVRAEFEAIRNALLYHQNHTKEQVWTAMVEIAVENRPMHSLMGEFRAAANIVHRLLIVAERAA